MKVYLSEAGAIVLDVDNMELHMDPFEAEALFVKLGHVLQDYVLKFDDKFETYADGDQPDV